MRFVFSCVFLIITESIEACKINKVTKIKILFKKPNSFNARECSRESGNSETVSQRVATFEISTLQLSNKLNRPVPFSPNL